MPDLLLLLALGLAGAGSAEGQYMTADVEPNPGPQQPDTAYQPGGWGGEWTEVEVESTRARVLQMIDPDWDVKKAMFGINNVHESTKGQVSENVLMRLVFHDCMRYTDGTGGCDGCLNWKNMGKAMPNANSADDMYNFEPFNKTDNNGLDHIVERLELVYTTVDWPLVEAGLAVSLQQAGKSRADLWQFASLVALELALERANRACDLDYHARQQVLQSTAMPSLLLQVTLLEGREACEVKLTKPLKFLTGRRDCVSDDPDGRPYVTTQPEVGSSLSGSTGSLFHSGPADHVRRCRPHHRLRQDRVRHGCRALDGTTGGTRGRP
jgi:hypothetical protein